MYNALTCTRRETKIQVLHFSFSSYLFIFVWKFPSLDIFILLSNYKSNGTDGVWKWHI
jgi:hypothetical protein